MAGHRKNSLSERQRRFVEAYMGQSAGNATDAAKAAGYSKRSAHVTGARLLKNAKISAAIKARQQMDPMVATREERQSFWTAVMRGEEGAEMRDRLKASELLARSCADFVTKIQVTEGDLNAAIEAELEALAGRESDGAAAGSEEEE